MRRRTRDTLTIVAACLAAGEAVAFGGSLLNGYLVVHPNVAPVTGVVGAVVGAAAAAFMIQSRARREEAYRAIRTASPEALEELLTRRRTSRSTLGANDELGLTALLVATGEHDDARARLLRLPRRLTTSHKDVLHLLRLQLDLAAGDPPTRQEAFERLAELPRHKHDYVEAFKAFLVAREHVRSGRPLPPGTLGLDERDLAGGLHAAEHAAIELLPGFAPCDRGDVGGLSTVHHADTGAPTVFVHDGLPGGSGFADEGYRVAERWLAATLQLLEACGCDQACPRCVVSSACGSGNHPLDRRAAIAVLQPMVAGAAATHGTPVTLPA